MYDDSRNTTFRRRLTAFAAAFAGVFLLGGVVIGVEFLELQRKPVKVETIKPETVKAETTARSSDNERITLEAKFRSARARTADARRQADATELAVFNFLNRRFVDAAEQASEPPQPEPRHAPVRPTIRPNPEWIRLNGELVALGRNRSELLVKLTPAHPTVQALDSEIAKAQDQLAATPAELPIDPSEIPNETPADREPSPTPIVQSQPGASPLSTEARRDYRKLLMAAGRAHDAFRAAEETETAALNACQHSAWPQIAMDRAGSVELPPRKADSHSLNEAGSPSLADDAFPIGAIAILTLLSIFAGMLAARRIERPTLTFMSAEEIEATLGLPVLGRLGDLRSEDAA